MREEDTGMDDEKSYVGKLLPYEEAVNVLDEQESYVVWFTYDAWRKTCKELKGDEEEEQAVEQKMGNLELV